MRILKWLLNIKAALTGDPLKHAALWVVWALFRYEPHWGFFPFSITWHTALRIPERANKASISQSLCAFKMESHAVIKPLLQTHSSRRKRISSEEAFLHSRLFFQHQIAPITVTQPELGRPFCFISNSQRLPSYWMWHTLRVCAHIYVENAWQAGHLKQCFHEVTAVVDLMERINSQKLCDTRVSGWNRSLIFTH